ncbi:MAG: ribose 5-phosphate isomerase B [Armatimonadetes bacterium]|nr:ribose 5-phosphate isomerase B [Armatimonadota bacterium]
MKVVIAGDHGGFALKEDLKTYIRELGYDCVDYGTYSSESVDYPDFAFLVADTVAKQENTVGIMIDGAGIGSAMVCNKVPGIRAAVCNDLFCARNSREHNDANVLTMGGRVIGVGLAREIVKVWLSCKFLGFHHSRRVQKIMDIEKKFVKCCDS